VSARAPAGPRVWLIGEQNPYGADPRFALYPLPAHAAGGRLAKILGMGEREYLRAFVRRNLLTALKWSAPAARVAADFLLLEHPEHDKLVLCGTRVSAAFGVPFRENLCKPASLVVGTVRPHVRHVLAIPHPSGLNREWSTDATLMQRVKEAVAAFREGTVDARPAAPPPGMIDPE